MAACDKKMVVTKSETDVVLGLGDVGLGDVGRGTRDAGRGTRGRGTRGRTGTRGRDKQTTPEFVKHNFRWSRERCNMLESLSGDSTSRAFVEGKSTW